MPGRYHQNFGLHQYSTSVQNAPQRYNQFDYKPSSCFEEPSFVPVAPGKSLLIKTLNFKSI